MASDTAKMMAEALRWADCAVTSILDERGEIVSGLPTVKTRIREALAAYDAEQAHNSKPCSVCSDGGQEWCAEHREPVKACSTCFWLIDGKHAGNECGRCIRYESFKHDNWTPRTEKEK